MPGVGEEGSFCPRAREVNHTTQHGHDLNRQLLGRHPNGRSRSRVDSRIVG